MQIEPSEYVLLLERVVNSSLDGMFVFDRQCRYVLWNLAMERISGKRREDVLGRCAFEVFPFLVGTGEVRFFREALSGNPSASMSRPFPLETAGHIGYYDVSYSPWRSSEDEVIGGIGIVRDVTEANRAAQRLAETEIRFRTMADVAPVMLWMSGTDGLCTFFNQTWLDFTGRSLAEEWGIGWAESVHFEDFQRCMDTYMAAFNRREIFEMEYRLRRKDGEYRWVLDRGTPRYTPDGTFAGYIGSCTDITERKRLEEELRQAVRVRDEFLSIASHELRTPLTTLQLQLESLLRRLEKQGDRGQGDERIQKNASRALVKTLHLGDMVNVLLDVSRVSEGRLTLEYGEFDCASLVREVVEHFKEDAASAQCSLSLSISGEAVGKWDRFRLVQIVSNLLNNAIKYGAGKPVEISLAAAAQFIQIRVADQGPGIPPDKHPEIFKRLVRVAPTRHYGGLGLGLWIVKELVQAHHGRINVSSKPGEGAVFEVELPIRPPRWAEEVGATGRVTKAALSS